MKTEGERLRYYIESKEVSVRNFCVTNNIIYSGFHQILQNSRNLGIIVLKQIIEAYPNLNINWVLTGKGSVEIGEAAEGEEPLAFSPYGNIEPGYELFLKYMDLEMTQNKINLLIENKLKSHEL